MSLNENVKRLIMSVADNNMEKSKQVVKDIIAEEDAVCNQYFCRVVKAKLDSQPNFMELPYDVKGLLKVEDVTKSFNTNRYFLSEREKSIFERICIAKNTNEKLAEMGIRYINSTLLYGESGTGKTTFGRYVAYKLNLPFAYVNFSQCISSHLGGTSKNIEKIFEYVSKQKCVLMLDELDAIGIERGKEDSTGEMSRVVISIMQALDLLDNSIIVLGATNRLDMIDKALLRRFSVQHEVKVLEKDEIVIMIENFLEDVKIKYDFTNLEKYIATHSGKQSEVITDIIKSISKMINNDSNFILEA